MLCRRRPERRFRAEQTPFAAPTQPLLFCLLGHSAHPPSPSSQNAGHSTLGTASPAVYADQVAQKPVSPALAHARRQAFSCRITAALSVEREIGGTSARRIAFGSDARRAGWLLRPRGGPQRFRDIVEP